ncbi:hypothetical protein Hanom_Chr05g00456681 [Helianthus anomalus]
MFSNNQNMWDPNHPFWQSAPNNPNNEQEDRYRRDPRTGELGYYPMTRSTPTSPHLTTPPIPGFYGYYPQPPFFPQSIPQNTPETQAEPTSSKGGRSRRHRKKGDTETRSPKKVEKWTPREEFAFAQAWLGVSEYEIVDKFYLHKLFYILL